MENNFSAVMSERTDEELIKIVTIDKDNYQLLAVEAAEQEIKKRQLDIGSIEKISNDLKVVIEEQQSVDSIIVNSWIRLLHFVIDLFASFVIALLLSLPIDLLVKTNNQFNIQLTSFIVLLISFLGYYIVMEFKYHKTLAKFITKTKVVKMSGQKPEISDIIIRTLFRLIPFDRVSFIFTKNGFHDYLSKTTVIKDNK